MESGLADGRVGVEARLIELYKNRTRQQPTEPAGKQSNNNSYGVLDLMLRCPAELLAAVHTSLQKKVASLEDDSWMFEAEQDAAG